MQQTPIHDVHNADLLAYIPKDARRLVEVGCSSGALAREYKKINANSHYIGIEIVPEYAQLAKRHCDEVMTFDIETLDVDFLRKKLSGDCWIFADSLEHLRDPWSLLSKIRQIIPSDGSIVACIPNAQHWSVQARLSCGAFVYEDIGLLDRTHLRWFTRATIFDMFEKAGFKIVDGMPRVYDEPDREKILPSIRTMATNMGADPDMAVNDALPTQYVVKATPVGERAIPAQGAGTLATIASLLRGKAPRFQ
ncbi:MAG: methyltransferase domain-containing protein [Burkholderiaceae bacterium]|nr:methyltransferase domain-containing protein [Burkholderiaceae bacterium]